MNGFREYNSLSASPKYSSSCGAYTVIFTSVIEKFLKGMDIRSMQKANENFIL